jgi:hypothetical protein
MAGFIAYKSAQHESPLVADLRSLASSVSHGGNPYKDPEIGRSYRADWRSIERFTYEKPIQEVRTIAERTFREWHGEAQTTHSILWKNPDRGEIESVALLWSEKMAAVFGGKTTCVIIVYYRPNWLDKVCGRFGL